MGKDVIAENRKILQTERTCMKWVKSHRRHNVVCRYCTKANTPSIRWKFYNGVWYRWWSGRWHYYGPSRRGHGGAWKWYSSFWHYKGYVFKYSGGKWWRFYGGRWHYYRRHVIQNPRCVSGRSIYMWEGAKKCNILGGRKWYQKVAKCKKGSLHKWQ